MHTYLNGQMVDAGEARIHSSDAGFQHAVGLFETMGVYHGKAFRLEPHLHRLARSAKALGLARQLDLDRLRDAVDQTIARNQLDHARLRLTVTAGQTSLLKNTTDTAPPEPPEPTVLIEAHEPTAYDPAYFEKGITATIGPPAANPFDPTAGHKTLAYWSRLITLRQAAAASAGETIWLYPTNHIASGAVSNIFLVKDGQLFTPIARGEEAEGALPAPVLPGITRAAIIELGNTRDIATTRRMITANDLLDADEVFLTNSSWLVLPVTCVEKKTIGAGQVGPVTNRLRTDLLKLIEHETSTHNAPD